MQQEAARQQAAHDAEMQRLQDQHWRVQHQCRRGHHLERKDACDAYCDQQLAMVQVALGPCVFAVPVRRQVRVFCDLCGSTILGVTHHCAQCRFDKCQACRSDAFGLG